MRERLRGTPSSMSIILTIQRVDTTTTGYHRNTTVLPKKGSAIPKNRHTHIYIYI